MNKTGLPILYCFAFVLLISIFSCSRCKDQTYPPLYFNESDLRLNPYLGFETLVFSDSLNDSVIYRGEGRHLRSEHNYLPDDCSNDGIDYFTQGDYCRFSDTARSNYISLELGFIYNRNDESPRKDFQIHVALPSEMNIAGSGGIYDFANDSILPGIYVSYANYVKLGKQSFTSVYILRSHVAPDKKEYISLVYYTVSDGIIALQTNKQHLWVIR
jgi:hypothetical protein